jgi:hypothetical protein
MTSESWNSEARDVCWSAATNIHIPEEQLETSFSMQSMLQLQNTDQLDPEQSYSTQDCQLAVCVWPLVTKTEAEKSPFLEAMTKQELVKV